MINVNFIGYTTYIVDAVTQWDVNRKLRITGLALSVAPVIYFSNKKSVTATGVNSTRVGGVITCDVPNALLTESYPIYAYLQITEDGETKTVETIKIPVTAAKEPDDYIFYDNIPVVTYSSLETEIDRLRAAVGSPLVAETAADMTNRTRIYVYVGSETGYTSGNWYYYDGYDWVSGGVYNSIAADTDKTLSIPDRAADAEAVGEALDDITATIENGYVYKTNAEVIASLSMHRKSESTVGQNSVALGMDTEASGYASFAEGANTRAAGHSSHAEGSETAADGKFSHAEGKMTKATADSQHVQGKYNVFDTENTYAHIVGNGTGHLARSNAHTIDWSGNAWFAGNVKVGGANYGAGSELATKEYVDAAISGAIGGSY